MHRHDKAGKRNPSGAYQSYISHQLVKIYKEETNARCDQEARASSPSFVRLHERNRRKGTKHFWIVRDMRTGGCIKS
jgi:hypothetical protein